MKLDLQNRPNNIFNTEDLYLCYDAGIKLFFISHMHFYNGFWCTNYGLGYRAYSILTQKCDELYGLEVSLKGLDYRGRIVKFQESRERGAESSFGINWYGGKQVKQNGLANFWTGLNKLDLKI